MKLSSINTSIFFATFVMLLSLLLCLSPVPVAAAKEANGWQVQVVPYLWFAGIDGDVSVGRIEASLDLDFKDWIEDFKFGAQGYIEARKGKLGFFLDSTYLKLESDADVGRFIDIEVETELWLVDFGVLYQIGKWPYGKSKDSGTELVLIGGGRYLELESEIGLTLSQIALLPGVSLTAERETSRDVTDPIVGARIRTDLSEKLRFVLRGDIGGFGAGTEFSWNIQAALGYELSDSITGWAGYRHLDIDLDEDNLDAEIAMSGPQLGVSFRF